MPAKSSLVLDDRPLLLLPRLATALGLEQALVLQQIHYLLSNPANGRSIRGRRWIFNTYAQWRSQYFPFWSERTIRRALTGLEACGAVAACQPDGNVSRRKYYRVNVGTLRKLVGANSDAANLATSKRPKVAHPLTETSRRDDLSKETEGTPSDEGGLSPSGEVGRAEPEHDATWIPDTRSKEVKLASIKPPTRFPSEREFDRFLEENECATLEYRADLYADLCHRKWRHWNDDHKKWVRIRNWQSYVLALGVRIADTKAPS